MLQPLLRLCLEELGIKLDLANGDVVIFPSQKISHFNTHFKGERVSIVFHTDAKKAKCGLNIEITGRILFSC